MKRFLTVAALVLAFSGSILADDAAKHPWGSFKVGSWVKLKTVMSMPASKMETSSTTTYKLIELTADDAVVEMETESTMKMAGTETKTPPTKSPPTKIALHPKVDPNAKTEGPKPEMGEEDVEIAGKKLHCTWVKTGSDANGVKSTGKSWTCTDVPGWSVKSESSSEGAAAMTMTTELVGFEAK